jgi:hypothetical protein
MNIQDNLKKLLRRAYFASLVNQVEKESKPNYIVEYMLPGGNILNNPKLDREICEYYSNKSKETKDGQLYGRSCNHCHGKGVLNFDRSTGEKWLQACYCVQKNLKKHEINLDTL